MTYTKLGPRALDYTLCQYGVSQNIFRGPRKSFCNRYIACLGGSETFGQSVPAPVPILTERLIGQTVVNLGGTHAGPDLFLKDDAVIDIARKAQLCVLQIMGAHNTNPYYKVHPPQRPLHQSAAGIGGPISRGGFYRVPLYQTSVAPSQRDGLRLL